MSRRLSEVEQAIRRSNDLVFSGWSLNPTHVCPFCKIRVWQEQQNDGTMHRRKPSVNERWFYGSPVHMTETLCRYVIDLTYHPWSRYMRYDSADW